MRNVFVFALLVAGVGSTQGAGNGIPTHGLAQAMTSGGQEMETMPMSGELDRDFVAAMMMHHRQGIKMAEIELRDGKDAKAKAFASKVIDAQNKEIKEYERWLAMHPDHRGENK